jgi:hypothetical protein
VSLLIKIYINILIFNLFFLKKKEKRKGKVIFGIMVAGGKESLLSLLGIMLPYISG